MNQGPKFTPHPLARGETQVDRDAAFGMKFEEISMALDNIINEISTNPDHQMTVDEASVALIYPLTVLKISAQQLQKNRMTLETTAQIYYLIQSIDELRQLLEQEVEPSDLIANIRNTKEATEALAVELGEVETEESEDWE